MNKSELKTILSMCVDASCGTLRINANYLSELSVINVHYRIGTDETFHQLLCVETNFKRVEKELNRLIDWHNNLYAPENIEATKESARLAKITELQKQIEALS